MKQTKSLLRVPPIDLLSGMAKFGHIMIREGSKGGRVQTHERERERKAKQKAQRAVDVGRSVESGQNVEYDTLG